MTREEEMAKVRPRATDAAEERILDTLLPRAQVPACPRPNGNETRQKFRKMLREGRLDDREIEVEVRAVPVGLEIMGPPGMEEMTQQLQQVFQGLGGGPHQDPQAAHPRGAQGADRRRSAKMINEEELRTRALTNAEQNGIVFIDEIDKICRRSETMGADVSREGVQRDLLPLVEGCTVSTKHGMVKTDHVLFIASGAFHMAKPSDLIPELQGRLPIRVELDALSVRDFERILSEPDASLCAQYIALLATEGVSVDFTPDGVRRIAEIAWSVNERTENIGARRLHTVMERLLEQVSFDAADKSGSTVVVDAPSSTAISARSRKTKTCRATSSDDCAHPRSRSSASPASSRSTGRTARVTRCRSSICASTRRRPRSAATAAAKASWNSPRNPCRSRRWSRSASMPCACTSTTATTPACSAGTTCASSARSTTASGRATSSAAKRWATSASRPPDMASSLLLLLDDIATILDDVSVMTKVAAKKTAGVLGDDLALNAEQVSGVRADRELPVVWAVAKGSVRNKLILVPAALAISAFLPWAVTPLLMVGGLFLCYEGFEKVVHKLLHAKGEDDDAHRAARLAALARSREELLAVEKDKIRGAIRTDFILSAEIIVIALGTVADRALEVQVGVLTGIAALMTVGVYGLVAGIVKLDDLGLRMSRMASAALAATGRGILRAAPWLMKALAVAGTAAMFLVGGGILAHGIHAVGEWIRDAAVDAATIPGAGAVLGALTPMLANVVVGIVAGGLAVLAVKLFSRLRRPDAARPNP